MTNIIRTVTEMLLSYESIYDFKLQNPALIPRNLVDDLKVRFLAAEHCRDFGTPPELEASCDELMATTNNFFKKITDGTGRYLGGFVIVRDIYNLIDAAKNGSIEDSVKASGAISAGVLLAGIMLAGAAGVGGLTALELLDLALFWYGFGSLGYTDMLWPALARIFGDPLVLDLNGDGVHLIGLDGSHVNFDFGADGFRERTGWASAGDGFLARDLDGNGKIESLAELFGTTTQDAFTMLRGFDIDGDGKITSADAVWSTLKVWQDANSNGITDAGELKTLADLGITEIGLGNTAVDRRVDGNYIHSAASFVMKGQTNEAQAVFFGMAPNIAIFTPPAGFVPNAEAANLPQLAGGGATPSLSRACTPQRKLGVGNRLAA